MSTPGKPQAGTFPVVGLAAPMYHAMVIGTGQGFKVRPAQAHVNGQANPFFRFKNNTKWPASVFLPPEIVPDTPMPVPIPAGEFAEIPLRGGGTYSYVVVLRTDGGIVTVPGESDPVIIIDPPAN